MTRSRPACQWQGDDLIIVLQVQPRAARDQWLGLHGAAYRVRITAPPVDGRANAHLICYLAEVFGVTKSDVLLLAGDSGRHKRCQVSHPRQLPSGIEARTAASQTPHL